MKTQDLHQRDEKSPEMTGGFTDNILLQITLIMLLVGRLDGFDFFVGTGAQDFNQHVV